MNVILWPVVALSGIGLLRIALYVVFNFIYIPTLNVRFFLDRLEYALIGIQWIGTATFFSALIIWLMEKGGAF